jgi:hypothetical protein
MADDVPTPEEMVPSLLHAVMWACMFGGVDAVIGNKPWPVWAGAFALSLISHIVGIKWPQIKPRVGPRFALILERIASNRLYRWAIYIAIAIALVASIGTAVRRFYHKPSSNSVASPQQSASQQAVATASDIKVSTVIIGTTVGSTGRMVVQETKKTPAGSKWLANIYYSNEGPITVDLHIYSTSSFITVDMANLEARTLAENMEWDRTINIARYPVGMRTIQTPPHQALVTSPMLEYHVGADDLRKIVNYKAAVYFMARFSYTVNTQEFHSDVCFFRMGNSPLVHQCAAHNSQ